jgi:hypothetical protein
MVTGVVPIIVELAVAVTIKLIGIEILPKLVVPRMVPVEGTIERPACNAGEIVKEVEGGIEPTRESEISTTAGVAKE